MTGQLFTACSDCNGMGKIESKIQPTSIGPTTAAAHVDVSECRPCRGSGQVLGVPATHDDLDSYFTEPCELTDQIFELAQSVMLPRVVKKIRRNTVRRERQVPVLKERKVGGFLGIGAKSETYQEIETQYYDEVLTEPYQEVVTPERWSLLKKHNRLDTQDDPYVLHHDYFYEYFVGQGGEFFVEKSSRETYTNEAFRLVDGPAAGQPASHGPLRQALGSLDHFMIEFDFTGLTIPCSPDGGRYESILDGPTRWGTPHREIRRMYAKGHGLLAALQRLAPSSEPRPVVVDAWEGPTSESADLAAALHDSGMPSITFRLERCSMVDPELVELAELECRELALRCGFDEDQIDVVRVETV